MNNVVSTTPTNAGCGSGLGIEVEAGTNGTASVTLLQNSVSLYGKNGITCGGIGVNCNITKNPISSAPTAEVAQNGVQVGFGAHGSVFKNFITGNVWTAYGTDTNPEVQSDFAAGVLLYGAGLNAAGRPANSPTVSANFLKNNQTGVEVVDSKASVQFNDITETGSGIPDSVAIFGVGCDAYCLYLHRSPRWRHARYGGEFVADDPGAQQHHQTQLDACRQPRDLAGGQQLGCSSGLLRTGRARSTHGDGEPRQQCGQPADHRRGCLNHSGGSFLTTLHEGEV